MDEHQLVFRVSETPDTPDVTDLLRSRFPILVEPSQTQTLTYFDTFDARLHAAGFALSRTANERLTLTSLGGRALHTCQMQTRPGFAWQLPEGSLRAAISRKLSIRKLFPLVEVDRHVEVIRILDADDKTVVRLERERRLARPPASTRVNGEVGHLPAVIRVCPVKGYDRELHTVIDTLEATPGFARAETDGVKSAVEATGGRLMENPSKIRLQLDPAATAVDAVRVIYRSLLNIMRLNEDGTRAALDTEFLHDYRVTVRRIRSALGQIKRVFPADDVARFAKEFKWLASTTGPARDADVFLLKLPEYRATLPDKTRQDLDSLKAFLRIRQCEAYGTLIKALDSNRYATLMTNWETYLTQTLPPSPIAPNADRPVRDVASARIWKVARRVLKRGNAIDDDTPAAALHELRIECKKLRYLLDFFASLYDPEEIRRLIRELRKLQDNLGDFNDCEVQQDALQRFATEMAAEGTTPVETFLAMGRLEDRLQIGQEKERKRFAKRFARFSSADNRQLMRRLFRGQD